MLFSWEGLSNADKSQQIAKTRIFICLLRSKSREFTRPQSCLLTCKDPSVITMLKIKGWISQFIRYNRVKFPYHLRIKLCPKFGNRWISRIGSLPFWWNSVQRKNASNSTFSIQTRKGRGIITTWHLLRSPKILCYIVDWSICYPFCVLDLR